MSTDADAVHQHEQAHQQFVRRSSHWERVAGRLSSANLMLFIGAVICTASGVTQQSFIYMTAAGFLGASFIASYIWQHVVLRRKHQALVRAEVHRRQLNRIHGKLGALPPVPESLYPPDHPYAADLDLTGEGSLIQRIDVTHTQGGQRLLAHWLGQPATIEAVCRRQQAVREMADNFEFRQELEGCVRDTVKRPF